MKNQSKALHLAKNSDGFVSESIPPLSDEDKDDLIINFLRCQEFFETAIAHLKAEHFDDAVDPGHCVIIAAIRNVYEGQKLTPNDHAFGAAVRSAITSLRDQFDDDAEGDQKMAAEEVLASGGLFRRSLKAKDHQIDPHHAMTLLARLLVERTALSPLQKLLREFPTGEGVPDQLLPILETTLARLRAVSALDEKPLLTFADEWAEHNKRLTQFRGKTLIGLKTGQHELDKRTLGLAWPHNLRGETGAGKTTLTLQIAVGVCEQVVSNDSVVVFLSLDMSRFDMFSRIHCSLADMDWKTLMFGSPESLREPNSSFSGADEQKLNKAQKRFEKKGIGKRMVIVDREFLGDHITAERLKAILRLAKTKAGVKRALLVVDYLQLIPVPENVSEHSDLAADKHRVRVIQQVLEGSSTLENPLGDTALVISEARKPPTAKDAWGDSLSDLMVVRLGYAADAVLLYREMSKKEIRVHYGVGAEADVDAKRSALLHAGIVPVMLTLEKGRDGMSRGRWPMEFLIWKSQFRPLNSMSLTDKLIPSSDDDGPTYIGPAPSGQASAQSVVLPKLPPGSHAAKAKKSKPKSSKPKPK